MTVFNEGRHAAEFVLSEAAGSRSRDSITIVSGAGKLAAGTVIGQIGGAMVAVVAALAGNAGDGVLTMAGTPLGASAMPGVYRATLIEKGSNAGSFNVEDPEGVGVGVAKVGVAFTGDHVQFTIADGATDFTDGDEFTVTVTETAEGEWDASSPDAIDGSENATGITLYAVNATSEAVPVAAIVRDAEVNVNILTYHDDRDQDAEKAAAHKALAAVGIIAR